MTVFDPDFDPDGSRASLLTDILVTGLARSAATACEFRPSPGLFTTDPAPGGVRAGSPDSTGSVKLPVFFPSFFLVSRLRRR